MMSRLLTLARRLGAATKTESLYFRKVLKARVRVGSRQYPLEDGKPLRFGRAADNDVVLEVGSASSLHAQMKLENGRIWVFDLGSTNGTLNNGKPVPPRQWVPVRSTDRVQLADQEIVLELELEPLSIARPITIPTPPPLVPEARGSLPRAQKARALPRRRHGSSAAERRANEIRILVGGSAVAVLLVLVAARACAGPKAAPVPQKEIMRWRLFGALQSPKGGEKVELVVTIPGIPKPIRHTYQVDAKGFYQYDFDLQISSDKRPNRAKVELWRNGKLLDAEPELSLPAPGNFLEVPSLGDDESDG